MSYTDPQEVLVVIPARGGSKGVPFKNLAQWAAAPWWCGPSARGAAGGTVVVVCTDDPEIAAAAETPARAS